MTQSNEPSIAQMNEAIARFMGGSSIKEHGGKRYVYYPKSCAKPVLDLKYHTSWDWLMPVVEKIEKLENGRFGFTIDPWGIDIIDYLGAFEGHGEKVIINVNREPSESTLLSDYYDTVYQFITWYNQQKQTNETNNG